MISAWTQHLKDPEAKEKFEREIRSCKTVFERLQEIVGADDQAYSRKEMSEDALEKPNYSERQAWYSGAKYILNKYKRLLDLDQKE